MIRISNTLPHSTKNVFSFFFVPPIKKFSSLPVQTVSEEDLPNRDTDKNKMSPEALTLPLPYPKVSGIGLLMCWGKRRRKHRKQ